MSELYVVGVGMTHFGQHKDRTLEDMAGEALNRALKDASCSVEDLGCAYYSGITNGLLQKQTAIPGQVVLHKIGVQGIPVYNVESACASGSLGFNLALQSLRAGSCDVALAIGAEKMHIEDKASMFKVFDGGWDVSSIEENTKILLKPNPGFVAPEGSESDRPYSLFMKLYASACINHMVKYGTTQRQIAAVCAKNHTHSVHNPYAQFQMPMTIEQVLGAPPITYPLTMPMCSPMSDGAAAVIVCNEDGLARLGIDKKRAIRVAASVVRSATTRSDEQPELHCERLAAMEAYEIAGFGPDDIHVAEVHDATAAGEIFHVENLNFVDFGEGGPAAERGEFTIGGRLPVNPSGGLESKGHPIGATGLAQIFELVTQLRGEAGGRQVDGARHALQENSGGTVGIEEAAVAVNIFTND
ncbi:thiolase family protein [Maricurvus nonylphenolicus]|uniref:thiolase family protein n=1 Tax=Maricurvus nonylphenolicus TaxID=1008307 RepID=UPI0036F3F508